MSGGYSVPANIGCPEPYLNACACRTDLQPSASTYLTACVDIGCSSDPSDLSSAISIYDSYCVSNGYALVTAPATNTPVTSFVTSPATVATASASTVAVTSSLISLTTTLNPSVLPLQSSSTSTSSSQSASPSTTPFISYTPTTIPTPTPSPTPTVALNPNPAPSTTNAGAIAGGVVSGVAVLVIIALTLFFIMRNKRKRDRDHIATSNSMALGGPPMQQQPSYQHEQKYAGPDIQTSELAAAGPFGNPAPTDPRTSPTAADTKIGTEIYETGSSPPVSPVRPIYEAQGGYWKA